MKREEREYRLWHRCRMCGRVISSHCIVTTELTIHLTLEALADKETVYPGNGAVGVSRTEPHTCENGDVGLCDLLGFRLRENDDRVALLNEAGFET